MRLTIVTALLATAACADTPSVTDFSQGGSARLANAVETISLLPELAQLGTGETQQFVVEGSPGPFAWWIETPFSQDLGTIDTAGLYRAPLNLGDPLRRIEVCVRLITAPEVRDCSLVHIYRLQPVLYVWRGNDQSVPAGTRVPIPPAVMLRKADATPWPGEAVHFEVERGGGRVTRATTVTGEDGVATVGSWTLSQTPGVNWLRATVRVTGMRENVVVFRAWGG
jgi:hypothetical protein